MLVLILFLLFGAGLIFVGYLLGRFSEAHNRLAEAREEVQEYKDTSRFVDAPPWCDHISRPYPNGIRNLDTPSASMYICADWSFCPVCGQPKPEQSAGGISGT